jgi:hypothetical protein
MTDADTTLGLTVDGIAEPSIVLPQRDLADDLRHPPDGAGILVWGPLFGGALIALVVLAVRFIVRVAG